MKKKPLDFLNEPQTVKMAELILPMVIPFIQALIWYGFTKIDKRANALNNLIALGEIIPAVDLGLPKGVVLAALYDKTEDSLNLINDLVQSLQELPNKVKEKVGEIVKETKEEITPDDPRQENESWIEYGNRILRERGFEGFKGFA